MFTLKFVAHLTARILTQTSQMYLFIDETGENKKKKTKY